MRHMIVGIFSRLKQASITFAPPYSDWPKNVCIAQLHRMAAESQTIDQSASPSCEPSGSNGLFRPKKVLILTKLTRYEFERRRFGSLDEAAVRRELERRGSDYERLRAKHQVHHRYLGTIMQELDARSIQHRLVRRWDYKKEEIAWADAILSAGGDGTFLLAASKVRDRNKPVIGINTDPVSSEGYLCLMRKLPAECFAAALDRLLLGEFKWLFRQRIRVTLMGKHAHEEPIELHDQQLLYPEYRWAEHVREQEESRLRSTSVTSNPGISEKAPYVAAPEHPIAPAKMGESGASSSIKRIIPYLALNEVFIGESLSSRVSYYEMGINHAPLSKQKSSGLTVCTGTGSTSWYFNINKLTEQSVTELLEIMEKEVKTNLQTDNNEVIANICKRFNEHLVFCPSDLRMAYAVRDPVFSHTFLAFKPRGFAERVLLKSRCWDAHLVIDGGLSYVFNDGASALLEILPEDALRTVVFR